MEELQEGCQNKRSLTPLWWGLAAVGLSAAAFLIVRSRQKGPEAAIEELLRSCDWVSHTLEASIGDAMAS